MLVVLPMQAHAQAVFTDGNKLVTYMYEDEKLQTGQRGAIEFEGGIYSGIVNAIHDTSQLAEVICPPEDTTARQVNAVVAAYLRAKARRWTEPAVLLVRDALIDAFHCG
jgi:hypothetical protein